MKQKLLLKIAELEIQSVCVPGMDLKKYALRYQSNEALEKTEVSPYHKYEYLQMNEWVNKWSIIHAVWMPGSMGTPGLQTGRAGFVFHPEKGWLDVWTDAWVSDSSAN